MTNPGGQLKRERRPLGIAMPHLWDVSPEEAVAIQEALRREIIAEDRLGPVRRVAGADVAYDRAGSELCAAVAVLSYPGLELTAKAWACRPVRFAYRPGLLAFREAPAILEALDRLDAPPDLLLVEGHGTAHPRRFGSACHVGVIADLPTVGVAKTRLMGWHGPLPEASASWVPLLDGHEVVGGAVRSRHGVRPVYVSPGHRVRLETAVRFTLGCVTRYRLPEPIRWAHRLAREGVRRTNEPSNPRTTPAWRRP